MKLHEIQHTLAELTKEYYAIGRTLDFEEWLTAQVMQLKKEAKKWEDANAKIEEKLRDEFEQKLNEATHADASEITSLRKDLVAMTLEREEFDEANKKQAGHIRCLKEIIDSLKIQYDAELEAVKTRTRWNEEEAKGWKEKWESAILEGDLLRTKNEELQEQVIEFGSMAEVDLEYQRLVSIATKIFRGSRKYELQAILSGSEFEELKNLLGA